MTSAETPIQPWWRRPGVMAAALGLLALAHTTWLDGVLPVTQFHKYPAAALQWLAGTLPAERRVDFSPLYLWLHVVAARTSENPAALVTWLHRFCTAGAVALMFLLLRARARTVVAWVGALMLLLDEGMLVYTRFFEPECVLVFLITLVLWLGARDDGRSRVLCGAVLGLGILTRPTLLPLAPLLPLSWWLADRASWRRQRGAWLGYGAAVAAALVVQSTYARSAAGESAPLMNPGTVFFEGNNPQSPGLSSVYPPFMFTLEDAGEAGPDAAHALYRTMARRSSGAELGITDVNAFWFNRGLAFLQDHPAHALSRMGHKLLLMLHNQQSHDVIGAYVVEDALRGAAWPRVPTALVSALALMGLVLVLRWWRSHVVVLGLVACQVGAMLVFYVSARQRLTLLPGLILLVGVALGWAWQGRRQALAAVAMTLVLAAPLWLPDDTLQDERHLMLASQAANRMALHAAELRDHGRSDEARQLNVRAAATAPWRLDHVRVADLGFPEGFAHAALQAHLEMSSEGCAAKLDRVTLALEAGEAALATPLLDEIDAQACHFNRRARQSSEPGYYRAWAALVGGDRPGATNLLREALVRSPGDAFSLALLHAVTGEAEPRTLLERYFSPLDVHVLLATACLRTGSTTCALEHATALRGLWPESRRVALMFAAALSLAGKAEEAVGVYLAAMARSVEPVLYEERILPAFAAWFPAHASEPRAVWAYARTLRQYGRHDDARNVLRQAREAGVQGAELDLEAKALGLPPN
ncbi:MAG: glycosyltransferase family 39 protein [Myxococcota bacterium]